MRGIVNAKDQRKGPFPRMDGVLGGWSNTMLFRKVTDTIVNFENVKTESTYPFEGVFQPMSSRDLFLKPEGQRNWKWWTLWVRSDYAINNGDIIEDFNGLKFKVMRSQDWNQAGFYRFDLLEDYIQHE
jgi:hypothetical protein